MSASRLAALRDASPTILPSLLKCDFGNLAREIRALEKAGARALHLDVMDGHFVPNLTYGMPIVAALREITDLPLDVHLMISDPMKYAKSFVEAGADNLTVHVEAIDDPRAALNEIRSHGAGAGLTLNPDTPLEAILPALDECDLVLVMSVDAGFGGQSFKPVALEKLRELRSRRPDLLLEVDGGVNAETIADCRVAGADLFVVGSAIFGSDDYAAAMNRLGNLVEHAGTA